MLLRELTGGDPPHTCKVIFLDEPNGFGHRVTVEGRLIEHVQTRRPAFDQSVAELLAAGYAETERSLTRRVFVAADRFWIIWLEAGTVVTQTGGLGRDWRESSGVTRDREYRDRHRAAAAYHRAVVDMRAAGYREQDAREVPLPAAPQGEKKSARRGAR